MQHLRHLKIKITNCFVLTVLASDLGVLTVLYFTASLLEYLLDGNSKLIRFQTLMVVPEGSSGL